MSKCKFCKKTIKWLEVPVDTAAGTMLKPKPFNPRARRGEPLTPHECQPDLQGTRPTTAILDEQIDETKKPWWLRD